MSPLLGCSAQGGESGEEQSGDSNFWMEAILSDITMFIFQSDRIRVGVIISN